MTGGVYSAEREMKLTFAVRFGAQPSQLIRTGSPILSYGNTASGTKKRTFRLPGGRIERIGRPAITSSPLRK